MTTAYTEADYWRIFDHISKVMEERGDERDPHEVTQQFIDEKYGNDTDKKAESRQFTR